MSNPNPVTPLPVGAEPAVLWQPSARYSDQPMSVLTHMFGLGGILAIILLILGGMLITWRTYSAPQAPPEALSVFDVDPPAAPSEPQREVPPGPLEVERKQVLPEPEAPRIELPEIQIRSSNPITLPAPKQVPNPGPSVEQSAPEAKPLPPAPQVSTGNPTWEGLVLGALNKVKRYPREASFRRLQGVPYIRFVMDREGRVTSVRLEQSSGFRSLDAEALALPKRAQPLPKPPESVPGDAIELVVPVEFFMR